MAFISVSMVVAALAMGAAGVRGVHGALGPVTTLDIANKDISPDGFLRSTVLAGGSHPGPLIAANRGQPFAIKVTDSLTDGTMLKGTSVHWHGLFQSGTNWADGPEGVNQCPISPGGAFTYKFNQNQPGTFWYHSHHSSQYCDGLRGPLVIYDPKDPHKPLYDVDNESTIISLADWYHIPAKSVGPIAYPDSTLINGKGRYKDGPAAPLAVISVNKGKRYRMRLINMACDPHFIFQIDGHAMKIIEVDGINHKPLTVDSIDILAGQRYSFVLDASKAVGNYWIRAEPFSASPGFTGGGFDGGRNLAILRYVGAAAKDPTTTQAAIVNPLIEKNLVPLEKWTLPGLPKVDGADININLAIEADPVAGKFYINGKTFSAPDVPVLLQIMSGAQTAQDLLPSGLVYDLPMGKSVQISMPAGALGGPHPMHLHGHAFSVVRSAGQTDYNWVNPPVRDVVSMGEDGSNLTIRFRTDNPGPWFLHCHIDWHLDAGFAVVFAEGMPETKSMSPPADWKALCPNWNGEH